MTSMLKCAKLCERPIVHRLRGHLLDLRKYLIPSNIVRGGALFENACNFIILVHFFIESNQMEFHGVIS